MEATRAAFQASISALQSELSGARERMAQSRAIANALESALSRRVFPNVEAQRQSQDRAAAYLRSLVGMGEINDLDALQAALQAVSDPSADTYATLEDYRRDFNLTSATISALEQTAGAALSADEQAVALLEQQIEDMEEQAEKELELMQAQLDALLGVSSSIQSLAGAISAFQAAQAAQNAKPANVYDFTGSDGGDGSDWQEYMRSVRSYDGGGYTGNGPRSGGLDGKGGFMAMLHPNETVTDHTKGGNAELVNEMRRMRAELAELKAINAATARSTNKSALIAEKWDEIGTPGTAEGEVVKTEAA